MIRQHVKILVFIFLFLLIGGVLLKVTNAQLEELPQNESSFSVSPVTVETNIGETFDLYIANNSPLEQRFQIEPVLLDLNIETRAFSLTEDVGTNLENYISLSKREIIIAANTSESIQVTYKDDYESKMLGIAVQRITGDQNASVGLTEQIISVIFDYTLDTAELEEITNRLTVKPETSFLGISFGSSYSLESTIGNNTGKLIKPSGEIRISDRDTTLETFSLTQDIFKNFAPGESVIMQFEFKDTRGFQERIGRTTFTQTILLDGTPVTISQEVLSIPLVFIVIVFIISAVTILIGYGSLLLRKRYVLKRQR